MKTKICPFCNSEFKTDSEIKRFCSRKCKNKYFQLIAKNQTAAKRSQCINPDCTNLTKRSHTRYCSRECYKKHHILKFKNRICACCSKPFDANSSKQVYCSHKCCDKHNRPKYKDIYVDSFAKSTEAICPLCSKKHRVFIFWSCEFTPRIFCKSCKDHKVPYHQELTYYNECSTIG